MIEKLQIRNLRGIRELDVAGLGRFNLVIGGNGSGKTTFLAAAGLSRNAWNWPFLSQYLTDPRPRGLLEFSRDLVPLCPGADLSIEPEVCAWGPSSTTAFKLVLQRGPQSTATVLDLIRDETVWRLDFSNDVVKPVTTDTRWAATGLWWSPGFVVSEDSVARVLEELYLQGQTAAVVRAVQHINPAVTAVELAGTRVYVRLDGHPLPLGLGVLGDGARRILEFSMATAQEGTRLILIDELENGFHYSTLPSVLELLRVASPSRQIFATTHREELIRTACECFADANDDGLRILRLDREGSTHRAVVYTGPEALAGLDSGLELRG